MSTQANLYPEHTIGYETWENRVDQEIVHLQNRLQHLKKLSVQIANRTVKVGKDGLAILSS